MYPSIDMRIWDFRLVMCVIFAKAFATSVSQFEYWVSVLSIWQQQLPSDYYYYTILIDIRHFFEQRWLTARNISMKTSNWTDGKCAVTDCESWTSQDKNQLEYILKSKGFNVTTQISSFDHLMSINERIKLKKIEILFIGLIPFDEVLQKWFISVGF